MILLLIIAIWTVISILIGLLWVLYKKANPEPTFVPMGPPLFETTSPDLIETVIKTDQWMLHCASGVKSGSFGILIGWNKWWNTSSFTEDTQARFKEMYPNDRIPAKHEIEAVLLDMIEGKTPADFNLTGIIKFQSTLTDTKNVMP